MSKYISTIVTLVVTFIVSLVLNSASTYFGGDTGSVTISRSISESNLNIFIISIDNYSKKFIDSLTLEVPRGISSKNFSSDTAVQFVDSVPSIDRKNGSIKINQISPRHITTVIISATQVEEGSVIRALNASELGLTLRSDDELESPLNRAIRMALLASVVQAVLLSIASYYFNLKLDKTTEGIKEAKENINKLDESRDKILKELRETKAYAAKIRILLLGKISDFSKELDFWRNLIKEITYAGGIQKGDWDKLQRLVKKTLKTYGATDSLPELDEIKIAAAWLREEDKRLDRD